MEDDQQCENFILENVREDVRYDAVEKYTQMRDANTFQGQGPSSE